VHQMPVHMAAEVRPAMSDSESVRTAVDVACADDRRHMAVSAAPAAVPRVAPMAPLPRTSVDAIRIAIGRLLVGVSVDGRRIPVRWTVAPLGCIVRIVVAVPPAAVMMSVRVAARIVSMVAVIIASRVVRI
jgi:hypothetical protein